MSKYHVIYKKNYVKVKLDKVQLEYDVDHIMVPLNQVFIQCDHIYLVGRS